MMDDGVAAPALSTCALDSGYFQAIYIAKSSGEADSLCVVRHWHAHSAYIAMMLRNSSLLNWTLEDVSKLGEWGFQFLTGLTGKASWSAVLSHYCNTFLPYVARRLSVSRPAKHQRGSDKQRVARTTLEAGWDAAFAEPQLREMKPALAAPMPEVVSVPIMSNSLVVWVGPHAGMASGRPDAAFNRHSAKPPKSHAQAPHARAHRCLAPRSSRWL